MFLSLKLLASIVHDRLGSLVRGGSLGRART